MSVDHYENFPVASWLCPAALRPAIVAIYRFARTADDLADEGDAPPADRLAALAAYRRELSAAIDGGSGPASRWSDVFLPLRVAMRRHALPTTHLFALLDAFEQDVRNPRYATRADLLDYCRRSADPVGRLMLHLYGVHDARSAAESDAICSALQLANFWQDLGADLSRGRCYVPMEDAGRHGVDLSAVAAGADPGEAGRTLVQALVGWTRAMMRAGAGLPLRVPGRAGWELRGVVQGGFRILDKIAAIDHATWSRRPRLGPLDACTVGWRALRMSAKR